MFRLHDLILSKLVKTVLVASHNINNANVLSERPPLLLPWGAYEYLVLPLGCCVLARISRLRVCSGGGVANRCLLYPPDAADE